jgi:hypothetical protein
MNRFKLLDVVALKEDVPEDNLFSGQVGTIVEVYNNGEAFEVEFIDPQGVTYGLVTLEAGKLLALHYEPVQIAA